MNAALRGSLLLSEYSKRGCKPRKCLETLVATSVASVGAGATETRGEPVGIDIFQYFLNLPDAYYSVLFKTCGIFPKKSSQHTSESFHFMLYCTMSWTVV